MAEKDCKYYRDGMCRAGGFVYRRKFTRNGQSIGYEQVDLPDPVGRGFFNTCGLILRGMRPACEEEFESHVPPEN